MVWDREGEEGMRVIQITEESDGKGGREGKKKEEGRKEGR
jgi:hypothetical protein